MIINYVDLLKVWIFFVELVEGLTRAQRSRLEDQRGTEINTELPDFLKDKENDLMSKKNYYAVQTNLEKNGLSVSSAKNLKLEVQANNNYENRNILVPPSGRSNKLYSSFTNNNNNNNEKSNTVNELNKLPLNDKNHSNGGVSNEPPPLPPKPKIVPTKPSNWGQNDYFRMKAVKNETNQNLFLEQPSSSFV